MARCAWGERTAVSAATALPRCPRCGSPFIRVARPKSLHENFLRVLRRVPCQCQVCGRRCTSAQAGLTSVQVPQDRRHFNRLATQLLARAMDRRGQERVGVATNLSIAGCQLQLPTQVADQAILRLGLYPTHMAHPIIIEQAIVRVLAPPVVGLAFVHVSLSAQRRLQQLVDELLREQWTSGDRERR